MKAIQDFKKPIITTFMVRVVIEFYFFWESNSVKIITNFRIKVNELSKTSFL